MKANSLTPSLPLQFPSPVKLPPPTGIRFPSSLTPKAISISTPNTNRISINKNDDDSIAAFWDYQFLFISQRTETENPAVLRLVDGAIPPDFPSGTYYLTGPGMFSDDHGSTVHPLDGHGYLRAFAFEKDEVAFMAKYVKTEAKMEEHDPETDRWRFTHRGPFSVLKGGKKLGNTKVMKNVANTSVLRWGGRLLCLWEGGDPYEIRPEDLDTVGKFSAFDGGGDHDSPSRGGTYDGGFWRFAAELLKPVLYGVFKMPPKRLLSHYKVDAQRNRLLIMSCNAEDMLLPTSHFTFYEFDSNFKLLQKKDLVIDDHLMIHDWAFTDNHYILFANRIKLDVIGAMGAITGVSPMISALSVNTNKSTSPIYLIPRFGEDSNKDCKETIVEVPSRLWVLHVGNAFEIIHEEDGTLDFQIHASSCSYQWFNFKKLFGYNWQTGKLDPSVMNPNETKSKQFPHLVKVCISLSKNGKCEKCSVEPLSQWPKSSDFPIINPKFSGLKHNYLYAATSSGNRRSLPSFPFDMIVKLDAVPSTVRTWFAGNRRFVGEPVFVPKGDGEDDGYLLVVEYAVSIQRCYLIILDAQRFGEADGVVARFEVPKHLNFPLGFHGFWAANT
ncbi:carotenoid cleavage dioxygenase 7, chloroplastic [Cucumis melo]|uniref:Carotenoid cleavage dioxygenase n=1 Tax=Cucumis melo TaxID=3656 RepID=T1UMH0_CUCME|nr:carotenoid cleavage dioxygenase 7, chloroplastic [Cucumis melo]AGT79011.1 carotenoid cleavage dioxygenase [Cucumis melo]